MNQHWTERLRAAPDGVAAAAIFVISAATILGAWFFQFVLELPPCHLCFEQRIPYAVIIPLSLLLTVAALARAPRTLVAVGFVVIGIAALCGAALGAYHAGVEWRFWAGPADCSGPLIDFKANGPLLDQLQSVHLARCDEAAWRFLGISLAGYNALIALLLAAIAAFALPARKPAA